MASVRTGLFDHIVDPLVDAARRVPVRARLAEFRAAQWDDVETMRRRQDKRLADILIHASTRVPFYRERVRGLSPESISADPWMGLSGFPILERDDLRNHLEDLRCETGRGTMSWSTGGSTGKPVRFYRDRHYLAAAVASVQLSYEWAGLRRGERHVRIWGARRDFMGRNPVARRAVDLLNSRDTLDAYRMTEARMREHVAHMNRRPPVLLEGYANSLGHLAGFVRNRVAGEPAASRPP